MCACGCRLDLLHDTGVGERKDSGACLVVWDWPLACVRAVDVYCVVSRTELQRRVNERTRMKYLSKECIDGMDAAAPPQAVGRMASSWRWKRYGDVGVGEERESRW
jgi:hypothetical protein